MLAKDVVEAVRFIVGDEPQKLHEPWLGGNEKKYVQEVIDSGHLSSGKWVERFEDMICNISGAKYAIATVNGTAALHSALVCSGLMQGTIKIPSLTFAATASAVIQAGMRPYFVEPENANIP